MPMIAILLGFLLTPALAQFTGSDEYKCVSKDYRVKMFRFPMTYKDGLKITLRRPNERHYLVITCDESSVFKCKGHSTENYRSVPLNVVKSDLRSQEIYLKLKSRELILDTELVCELQDR